MSLPAELRELEERLQRARAEPAADWQRGLVNAVNQRLPGSNSRSTWSFIAAVAAGVLIWLNISLFAAGVTEIPWQATSLVDPDVSSDRLRALFPELNDDELQCVLVRMNVGARPAPQPRWNPLSRAAIGGLHRP
jgi:hypothetical protein